VAALIKGRVVVGYTLACDLEALKLDHPWFRTEDMQTLPEWRMKYPDVQNPGLRVLAQGELGVEIQLGKRDSVTDARAAMALYRLYEPQHYNLVAIPITNPQLSSTDPADPTSHSGEIQTASER